MLQHYITLIATRGRELPVYVLREIIEYFCVTFLRHLPNNYYMYIHYVL